MSSLRRLAAAAALALALPALAACSGGDDPSQNADADADGSGEASPAEVLAFAGEQLGETAGVRLRLSTTDTPDVDPFLGSAEGVVTRAPAFEGQASGTFQGQSATVAVRSVDGTFYAELPIVGWQDFDPATLCAPDPATLIDPDAGVSSVLAEATDVEQGDEARAESDNEVTGTRYTATVPGSAMKNVLPCAPGDTFEGTFLVDADGRLREAVLTGEFFSGAPELTYTIFLSDYGVEQDVTAPTDGP
ncbi:LppX_LprAFG lipoprotein [Nocardioides litoris]|uniref:LppX_LprAFG lipoprotein n=1 Tax=Nocardioides litoris TaxID=1926648 RepID=UPI001120166D|nr:LppX_LprAFG lipoprotein [Nocardioides litoris]